MDLQKFFEGQCNRWQRRDSCVEWHASNEKSRDRRYQRYVYIPLSFIARSNIEPVLSLKFYAIFSAAMGKQIL